MKEIVDLSNTNMDFIKKICEMHQNIITVTLINKLPNANKASLDKIYLKLCFSCRTFFMFTGVNWIVLKHEELHDSCDKCKMKNTLNCNKEIMRNIND